MTLKNLLVTGFLILSQITLNAQSSYVYNYEFDDIGTWTNGSNSTRNFYVSSGKYYFEHKKSSGDWEITTRSFYLDFTKDFEIETAITKISGVQDYGISFLYDYKDSKNYKEFGITASGYYRVAKSANGSYTNEKSWTKSSTVKTGNYATNKLTIKRKSNRITFYINDTYVYGMDYSKFVGNQLGLRLYRNQKVAIDYFRVKYSGTTPTVNPTTQSKSILFEGFNSNANNWSETKNSDVDFDVKGGDYILSHKRKTGGYTSSIYKYIDTKRDFRISAEFKKISGVENNGFGLIFGREDSNNQNYFFINSNGSYIIKYVKGGQETFVKNWTYSGAIKKGRNAYNVLKVVKEGSALKYYINNSLVHTRYSFEFYGQRVGFILYDKQKIAVSYLSLYYLDDGVKPVVKPVTDNKVYHTIKESIFFEGFTSNANNWSEKDDSNVKLSVNNGNYTFGHKRTSGGWTSTINKYIDTSRDFQILVSFKKISGIQNNGYGITFGRKDSNNQYLFYINGQGSYSINRMSDGNSNYIKDWTPSSAISKGNGAYNYLKVVKNGSKLEYYINDILVTSDFNTAFFGDSLGFIVYNQQEVDITYMSVGYLDDKKTIVKVDDDIDNIKNFTYNDNDYFISEQFNSNSKGWYTADDNLKKFEVKNGKYYIDHKRTEKGWSSYVDHYIDTSKDFEIETKIDKINGVQNYGYGLIWGKDSTSEFIFYIASNGYYKITRKVNDVDQDIVKWTTSSSVLQGNGVSNVLKVRKEGNYYKFYINDTYITQLDYENFYGNKMGYIVYNKQQVAVDYLRVKYLTSSTVIAKVLKAPLYDNFSSNTNGWDVEDNENYTVGVNSGKLVLERKKKGGSFTGRDIEIDTSKDFIIETTLTREKSGGTGLFGVTFGRKNSSNEFSFLINTSGNYLFRKFENDKYTGIILSTFSSAIKTGVGQSNKIKIVKSGSLLRFYINDVYVNEASFQPFYGNKFGYTAYFEQKIMVDDLDIKYQTNTYNDPPIVVITEPTVERGFNIVKTKDITVKGKATDKDGIYEVFVNNVEATLFEDGSFTAKVPLKIGSNELVVKATDIKQATSNKTFTIKRKTPDIVVNPDNPIVKKDEIKLDVGFGKYYALLIGVSDYNDASDISDLEGLPTRDAANLYDVLVNKYSFEKENVVLLNNSPTENEILREFVKLRQKVTEKDNVLIFYAGHGIYDEETQLGSWLPSDADPQFDLNIISNSTVKDYIKSIKSKHTLLISDACFSGSIFKTRSVEKAPKSIKLKFDLPSRKAITSGTLKTVPNESVFLKYLLKYLNNNEDKYITARAIFDRIEGPVINNSPNDNVPQYGTIQEVGDEMGDFIFIKRD